MKGSLKERGISFKSNFGGFFKQDMLPGPCWICSSSWIFVWFKFVEPAVTWKWLWVIETPYSCHKWLLWIEGKHKSKWEFASFCSVSCFAVEQLPRTSNNLKLVQLMYPCEYTCPATPCSSKRIQCIKGGLISKEWGKGVIFRLFLLDWANIFHLRMLLMKCQNQPRRVVHSTVKMKSAYKLPEDHKVTNRY